MRALYVLTAVIVGMLALGNTATAGTYVSNDGYKITPPPGWSKVSNVAHTGVAFAPNTNALPSIVVIVLHNKSDLESRARAHNTSFLEGSLDTVRKKRDFKILDESDAVIDGAPAKSYTARFRVGNDTPIIRMCYVCFVHRSSEYSVACAALNQEFDTYRPLLGQSLASFRFADLPVRHDVKAQPNAFTPEYTFRVPADWITKHNVTFNGHQVDTISLGLTDEMYAPNIQVAITGKSAIDLTGEDFYKGRGVINAALSKEVPGVAVQHQRVSTLGGISCLDMSVVIPAKYLKLPEAVSCRVFMVQHNGVQYRVAYYCRRSQQTTYDPLFQKIIKSWHWAQ